MTVDQEQEHKCSYAVNITTQVSEVCVTCVIEFSRLFSQYLDLLSLLKVPSITFVLHNRHYVTTFFELLCFAKSRRHLYSVWEYLQSSREGGRSQERVAASMTVRGMETANRRSDSAREEMKMLRAVLSSGRHTAASITARLPGTAECYWCYWISGMYCYFEEFSLKMFNLENKSFAFAQEMLYKCAVYGIASLNVNMLNKP